MEKQKTKRLSRDAIPAHVANRTHPAPQDTRSCERTSNPLIGGKKSADAPSRGGSEVDEAKRLMKRRAKDKIFRMLAKVKPRDRRLLKALMENDEGGQAMLQAGYAATTAACSGRFITSCIERNREAFTAMLELEGIDLRSLAAKHAELMGLELPVERRNGEIMMVPDGKTQVRALELTEKVIGLLDTKKTVEHTGTIVHRHEVALEMQKILKQFDADEQKAIEAEYEVRDGG